MKHPLNALLAKYLGVMSYVGSTSDRKFIARDKKWEPIPQSSVVTSATFLHFPSSSLSLLERIINV